MNKCTEIQEQYMSITYKSFLKVTRCMPSVEFTEEYVEWLESELERLSQIIKRLKERIPNYYDDFKKPEFKIQDM